MIAYINTPIQGVSNLCRKWCAYFHPSMHQKNASFHAFNDSFYDSNEHIYALNEIILDFNECLYDVKAIFDSNEKKVVPALSYQNQTLSPLIISTKIRTHDTLCVIKGVFYVPKSINKYGFNALLQFKSISYAINDCLYDTYSILSDYINRYYDVLTSYYDNKSILSTIINTHYVCKDASKAIFNPYYVLFALIHAIKDVYYVINDMFNVAKDELYENKESSMMTRERGGNEDGTCNEAIMRGGLVLGRWL